MDSLEWLLAAVDVSLFDADGIDDADDDTVDREFACLGGKPSAASLRDQYHVADPCSQGVDGDEGTAGRDHALSVLGLESKGLDHEQLLPK